MCTLHISRRIQYLWVYEYPLFDRRRSLLQRRLFEFDDNCTIDFDEGVNDHDKDHGIVFELDTTTNSAQCQYTWQCSIDFDHGINDHDKYYRVVVELRPCGAVYTDSAQCQYTW